MSVNMTLPVAAPKAHPRGGERGGKDAQASGHRFNEALGIGKEKPGRVNINEAPDKDARALPVAKQLPALPSRLDRIPEGAEEGIAADMPETDDETPTVDAGIGDQSPEHADPALAVLAVLAGGETRVRPAPQTALPPKAGEDAETQDPPKRVAPAQDEGSAKRPPATYAGREVPETTARPAALQPSVYRPSVENVRPAVGQPVETRPAGQEPVAAPQSEGSRTTMPAPARTDPFAAERSAFRIAGATVDPALSARVNVLGFTSAPAPAPTSQPLPTVTAAGLVSAIEAEPSWRAAAASEAFATTGQRGQGITPAVSSLRIQLHPAELGMVTARLTASGSQLSIEIQTETSDARQRLANDSEMIVKALRAIGLDIDKVTIQQTSQSTSSNGQQQAATGRDPSAAQGDNAQQGGRGGRGGGTGEGEGSGHGSSEVPADRSGGGLYI